MFEFLNTMMNKQSRWEHDCGDCTYLGPWQDADLYACILGHGPDDLKIDTVVARYGSEGEYKSGLDFVNSIPALGMAYVRAQEYILQVRVNALAPINAVAKPDNVPDAVKMNAFNLWEGATFMTGGRVYIVHRFQDYGASEKVLVETHRGDADMNNEPDYPFLFDYMDKVAVIGNVRNPQDIDDNDWGN